ncbi:DNA recombination protein RmuC [Nocardia beijingensis]|uniref:DNA recombination protein RmuC n=1 Tax=Nocardia beijingensis TaxID=95162 RepID=UPI0035312646
MRRTSHQITGQIGQLVAALRAPRVHGRRGEIQLERVAEPVVMTGPAISGPR